VKGCLLPRRTYRSIIELSLKTGPEETRSLENSLRVRTPNLPVNRDSNLGRGPFNKGANPGETAGRYAAVSGQRVSAKL